MILRTAHCGDADAVCAIANPIIQDTLVTFTTDLRIPEQVKMEIAGRGTAFQVAETESGVVGFATFGPFRKGPGYAATAEHTILLAPSVRGSGIGRALMTRLEQVARDRGIHVLVGGISGANTAGILFHKRMGFVQTGQMPEVGRKNGQWLDLVLMQKILGGDAAPDSGQPVG